MLANLDDVRCSDPEFPDRLAAQLDRIQVAVHSWDHNCLGLVGSYVRICRVMRSDGCRDEFRTGLGLPELLAAQGIEGVLW